VKALRCFLQFFGVEQQAFERALRQTPDSTIILNEVAPNEVAIAGDLVYQEHLVVHLRDVGAGDQSPISSGGSSQVKTIEWCPDQPDVFQQSVRTLLSA
jgi:hypothetical protein